MQTISMCYGWNKEANRTISHPPVILHIQIQT